MDSIQYEQQQDKLTITLPIKRNWPLFSLLTLALIIWAGMSVTILVFLFEEWRGWVFSIMLVVWLFMWYLVGRKLWERWKYYAATQEHLYLEKELFVIHRQAALFSLADGFDRQYMTPWYRNDKTGTLSFAYGSRRIDFGYDLPMEETAVLIKTANQFYFPNWDEDEE